MSKSNFGDSNCESQGKSYFKTKLVSEFLEEAKSLPPTLPLFGSIWHSGELIILFADTGIGKSSLVYSLFDAITSRKTFLNQSTSFKKVLYFDFELSSQSIYQRYTNLTTGEIYPFDSNFIRSEINMDKINLSDDTSSDNILSFIKDEIINHEAEVVCIDNISFISTDNEKSRFATKLMKGLLQLTRKYGLSILVLAHEPKEDKTSNKLSLNRLAGSKALSNFADSIFALGKSKILGIVYLKELKNRNREIIYHENNVMVLERIKKDNFLTFQFVRFDAEVNMIEFSPTDERNMQILEMKNRGISNIKIGEEFNLSEGAIRKILKKLQE
ncbi:AAA family ATPase [Empedobacter falsenii]